MTDGPADATRPEAPDEGIVVENVSHGFDGVAVLDDVSFRVGTREILTLLGPSGGGKTTMLRIVAGIEEAQQGRVLLDGRVLSDGRIHVPPEERSVSLLFQDFALFPHLSVVDNVIFGLDKWPAAERRQRAMHVLSQVGMSEFAEAFPHVLSGGQQQRVALARARAPRPRMMLMDEPFSSLDTMLRRRVRDMMLRVLQNSVSASLMVTHDAEEAMFMSDRIAVMNHGRIVQQGRPEELYNAPNSAFVMGQFGEVNSLTGRVRDGEVETPFGPVAAIGLRDGAPVRVLIRVEGLIIDSDGPVRGKVLTTRMLGRAMLVHIGVPVPGGEDLHLHSRRPASMQRPKTGDMVGISMLDQYAFVFPIEGEEAGEIGD